MRLSRFFKVTSAATCVLNRKTFWSAAEIPRSKRIGFPRYALSVPQNQGKWLPEEHYGYKSEHIVWLFVL